MPGGHAHQRTHLAPTPASSGATSFVLNAASSRLQQPGNTGVVTAFNDHECVQVLRVPGSVPLS